jgi:hypothetical protein
MPYKPRKSIMTSTNPITVENGKATWTHRAGDTYAVTGTDRNGVRFKRVCGSFAMAKGINTQQGTRWLVRDGRKFRIQRIGH